MVSKREKYIIKDNLRRSQRLKQLYADHLKKSLFHNFLLEKHKRYYLSASLRKSASAKCVKNVCMLSGENSAVRKYFLVSRFRLNYLSIGNNLQSFKLNSW
jgi:hypothetical protein